jgi:transposase-like protein
MTEEKKDWRKGIAQAAEALVEEYGFSREALFGENGVAHEFRKALIESALQGEMTYHLGYPPGGERPEGEENSRNGYSKKRITSKEGEIEIEQPRDRQSTFKPLLIEKGQKRFDGWDDKIIGMYARGMSVREIRAFLMEEYKIEVSPDFISTVTDSVVEEIKEWQNRPLEETYAIVYIDALRVKIRDQGVVKNKAVYLALGVRTDGDREILGIWIEENEGAKFWQKVLNELKNRGVSDILIAVIDGLKGLPEAINAIYPETQIQTCIVHLTRHSLSFCNWKDRKIVAQELKEVYKSPTAEL